MKLALAIWCKIVKMHVIDNVDHGPLVYGLEEAGSVVFLSE